MFEVFFSSPGSKVKRARFTLALFVSCIPLLALSAETVINEPIKPLPLEHNQDAAKVALGERLFHDVRLSVDNSISCASCHILSKGGVDSLALSPGVNGKIGVINAPTVYNSGFNLAQFWDGRAHSLEAQASGPVHNPLEMGSNWKQVLSKLGKDSDYAAIFSRLYPDAMTPDNIVDAIASFERTLITTNAPFDRWLRGDKTALTEQELHGYRLFKGYGCIACHQGTNVGGNMYQQMGIMGDYFADREGEVSEPDEGRYNVTGDEADRHHFKVPSLRLASLTAPYFHDASADTLDKAIQVMAKYQLGRQIPSQEREAIAAFIKSLTGRHPKLDPK
jgi:cytochrome c peroxidase